MDISDSVVPIVGDEGNWFQLPANLDWSDHMVVVNLTGKRLIVNWKGAEQPVRTARPFDIDQLFEEYFKRRETYLMRVVIDDQNFERKVAFCALVDEVVVQDIRLAGMVSRYNILTVCEGRLIRLEDYPLPNTGICSVGEGNDLNIRTPEAWESAALTAGGDELRSGAR